MEDDGEQLASEFPTPPGSIREQDNREQAPWFRPREPSAPPTIEHYQAGKAYIDDMLLREVEAWLRAYTEDVVHRGIDTTCPMWIQQEFIQIMCTTIYNTVDIEQVKATMLRNPTVQTERRLYLVALNANFGYCEQMDDQGWGVLWFQRQSSMNKILAVIYSFWPYDHERTTRLYEMAQWFLHATNPAFEIHLQVNYDENTRQDGQDASGSALCAVCMANAIAARYPEIPTHGYDEENLAFTPDPVNETDES